MNEQPSCLSCGPLREFSATPEAIDNDLETAKRETCWIAAAVLPPSPKDVHSSAARKLLGGLPSGFPATNLCFPFLFIDTLPLTDWPLHYNQVSTRGLADPS